MASVLEAIWWIVAGWVAIDAARRRRLWFAWALLVCSTTFVGLTIWLLVRRLTPAGALAGGRTTTIWLGLSAIPVGVLSLILVTWTTTFVAQVAEIEGDAMAPALVHHDDVLVNRMAYRAALPGRGDVVLLRYPLNPDTLLVRRVVAVEGDSLHIRNGLVFVNNVPRPDTEVAPEAADDLTQAFFARVLEKDSLKTARPERGRFRSFLLTSVRYFLANQLDHQRAARRGGGRAQVPS